MTKFYFLSNKTHTLGIIPGVKSFSHQLDVSEVYEIGLYAYDQKDFTHAGEWMRTALEMLGNETDVDDVEKDKVLDYLAFAEFKVIILWWLGFVYQV